MPTLAQWSRSTQFVAGELKHKFKLKKKLKKYSNKINPLLPQRRTPLSRSQSLRETKSVAKWRVPHSDTKDVISLVGDQSHLTDIKRGNSMCCKLCCPTF